MIRKAWPSSGHTGSAYQILDPEAYSDPIIKMPSNQSSGPGYDFWQKEKSFYQDLMPKLVRYTPKFAPYMVPGYLTLSGNYYKDFNGNARQKEMILKTYISGKDLTKVDMADKDLNASLDQLYCAYKDAIRIGSGRGFGVRDLKRPNLMWDGQNKKLWVVDPMALVADTRATWEAQFLKHVGTISWLNDRLNDKRMVCNNKYVEPDL